MSYEATIGLEIHAELKTNTKLFCNSRNDSDEKRPNVNICPVCVGYPGTLPVINKKAIEHVVRVGIAIGGNLANVTYFDRKNYFYPDIPKGYQISQYEHPLVSGGELAGVAVTRVHLEEDTARSQHTDNASLIDFNRSGIPLMELVTEPVIKDAEAASRFAKELQLLLRVLGVGEANMEKGEMRVEANISVSKDGTLGTKVEVKNLNSFRSVERAISHEIKRQSKLLDGGGDVLQETRGWDEAKQKTFSQRSKEGSKDYRYFPEPDMTMINIPELFDVEKLTHELPELPWGKRDRYQREFGIKAEDAALYAQYPLWGAFFDEVACELGNEKRSITLASNYITSDMIGFYKARQLPQSISILPRHFARLIAMVTRQDVSSRGAKDVLRVMLQHGGDPEQIAKERELLQQSDEEGLLEIVTGILSEHSSVVEEYKKGKEPALQFLVGQGMKATKGAANPEVLKKVLIETMTT